MTTKIIRPTLNGESLLSIEEAAEKMGLSVQSLYTMRAERRPGLPAGAKLGRRVWFRETDVNRYIESKFR